MRKRNLVLLALLAAVALPIAAQDTYYSIFSYDGFIPEVTVNERTASLQRSLLPEFYRKNSLVADLNWLKENDSAITNFWYARGDTVLHMLHELSGFEWYESSFEIYVVRYHQTIGSGDPVVVPLGGIKRGNLFEVAPDGNRLTLDLVYQLAHRMLDQTVQPQNNVRLPIADHPLLRPSPYRRDNMAMLLALSVCQSLLGYDSTETAYQSAFWKNHFPGRQIFETYLQNKWVLTPSYTLSDWLHEESWSSELVRATRPPRREQPTWDAPQQYVEGLPLRGDLGMAVSNSSSGLLRIDKIDQYRLAYACGLREGDLIRRVNGRRVGNHKELIEKLFVLFEEEGGATVQLIRDDQTINVVVQPMMLPIWGDEDELYYDDIYHPDSLIDSTGAQEN